MIYINNYIFCEQNTYRICKNVSELLKLYEIMSQIYPNSLYLGNKRRGAETYWDGRFLLSSSEGRLAELDRQIGNRALLIMKATPPSGTNAQWVSVKHVEVTGYPEGNRLEFGVGLDADDERAAAAKASSLAVAAMVGSGVNLQAVTVEDSSLVEHAYLTPGSNAIGEARQSSDPSVFGSAHSLGYAFYEAAGEEIMRQVPEQPPIAA
jgi:hypothetical protein